MITSAPSRANAKATAPPVQFGGKPRAGWIARSRERTHADPLFTHGCHCLNCQQQTGTALVINLLIETDRVQLLAGDNSRSRHLPTTAARSGSSDVQPVRWRSTPSTDAQDCGSSVAARSTTSPSSVGQALEGVLWFFPRRRLPPQVRGTFRGQCVQRLAGCRKSCVVVSATSPEALRGRWHCLASDSSRES
jgi:hypothetical protein